MNAVPTTTFFLSSKLSHTCAYHPSANCMCKRFDKKVKTFLRTFADTDWVNNLPWVLLGIRSSLKMDLGCSAAQLALGTSVCLPGQYFDQVNVNNLSLFEYFDRFNCFISSFSAKTCCRVIFFRMLILHCNRLNTFSFVMIQPDPL